MHFGRFSRHLSREKSGDSAEAGNFLDTFRIPNYILNPNSEPEVDAQSSSLTCPVIVFINGRSGGQLGGELLKTYQELLSGEQVFDLGAEAPERVLQRVFSNLERLKHNGDELAARIEETLRLIVAGGDGTASWLLGVICDLKLSRAPPVATVPLGTGNNLPYSFGWGKKNPGTDKDSVTAFLKQVMEAREMKIDNWHIIMRMRSPEEGPCEPIAPLELPHSLHAFHHVSSEDSQSKEGHDTFRGGFWNYFSMGMDAQVSYSFHSERKLHPEKFKNQLINQSTYLRLGLTSTLVRDSSRNMALLLKAKCMKEPGGEWVEVTIPDGIKSIICVNLPSFSGGLNPWGIPRKGTSGNITAPFVDDGRIEVVGFRDVLHGLTLLSSQGHGHRLAQAHRIIFEFHKGAADHTYMRMDGEPWKQPLPVNDGTVVVEISHHGQVNMLASAKCVSKSFNDDPSVPQTPHGEDDSVEETSEERRKFGAAETFKIPDDIDIAALS